MTVVRIKHKTKQNIRKGCICLLHFVLYLYGSQYTMAVSKQEEYYKLFKKWPKSLFNTSSDREWMRRLAEKCDYTEAALRRQLLFIKKSEKFDLPKAEPSPANLKPETTSTDTNYYPTSEPFPAVGDDGKIMNIDQYCEHWGLPRGDVHSYKLVTHTGTPYYNIAFKECVESKMTLDQFELIIDETISRHFQTPTIPSQNYTIPETDEASRLVFTDVHVGMDPNPNGQSLYGGKWDQQEMEKRFMRMVEFTSMEASGEVLYIDDLGDFMDGWESYTARKDHRLQQNMDSERAFDLGFDLKTFLIDALVPEFDKIILNNICNDNHAGPFAYIVNQSVKRYLEAKYPGKVQVNNIRKFMGHYKLLDRWKVLSHGKDEEFMRAGMPVVPKPEHIDKIEAYCKAHGLMDGSPIDFCKGDSHQCLMDFCSSDEINYWNYPAFSPSSGYVQTNFSKGRSGFFLENYRKGSNFVEFKPYFFNWVS